MATTNWASADLFYEEYPRTFRFLQDLVLAMEECAKNIGKKSFFGKDKGLIAVEKFEKALTSTLLAMVADGIISKNDSPSEIRLHLLNMIKLFASVFPNWQLAYVFAYTFFERTAETAEKKIKEIMMFMSGVFREAAETMEATEELQVIFEKAKQGDASAQCNLGVMFMEGQGVSQNYAEAVNWYRKAAEQGDVEAQYFLGSMYGDGQGVPQSDVEAVKWYRKAAEQGFASAQHNLGAMYAQGRGVSQSNIEAVKWCYKAAEQGFAKAQYSLGGMYLLGQGVPLNSEEAYMWFYIAVTNGYEDAQELLALIENEESYQVISIAKQRAQEFLAKQAQ